MSPNTKKAFNFCIIGENSIALKCCEILFTAGHNILVFVTQNLSNIKWAEERRINVCYTPDEIDDYLSTNSIDYLLSIVNSAILSSRILSLAKYAAINYHDSILPKYAGLNATTWAIINNEKEHGITWHIMTERLDAGDILLQESFPIDAEETCLSLNLKCYETAINSFKELLIILEGASAKKIIQNNELRTLYTLKHKPPFYGTFNVSKYTAEELYRFYRSLYMGNYTNHVCSFKLIIGNNIVIPEKLYVTDKKSTLPAGKIISIDSRGIYLSTLSNDIFIENLKNIVSETISYDSIDPGESLLKGNDFSNNLSELDVLAQACASKESYWLNILSEIEREELPHIEEIKKYPILYTSAPLPKIDDLDIDFNIRSLLIAVIFIYFYRINNYKNFHFFIENNINTTGNSQIEDLIFSKYILVKSELTYNQSLINVYNQVNKCLLDVKQNLTFAYDIFDRYDNISFENNTPNISISFNNEITENKLYDNKFNIIIDLQKGTITFPCIKDQLNASSTLINNLGKHVCKIINAFYDNNNCFIRNLFFLTDQEMRKIKTWENGKKIQQFYFNKIDQYFDRVALQKPEKTAIIENNIYYTYNDIYHKTGALSNYFTSIMKSCRSGRKPIIIFIDRSADYVISVLSILKANCSFIPVDTTYPTSRIKYVIDDSKPYLIVTTMAHEERINNLIMQSQLNRKPKIVSIDADLKLDNKPYYNKNKSSIPFNQYSYTIYTSGTTGAQKGVLVTHSNVINYYYWFKEIADLQDTSIFDFSSSVSFDLSIPCYLIPLMHGSTVSICDEKIKLIPEKYLTYLNKNNVTHIEITPGYFSQLITNTSLIRNLKSLQYVLLGAEALIKEDVKKWYDLNQKVILINEYGPTECTVACVSYKIDPSMLASSLNSIPIGTPCINSSAYILDKFFNICPVGAAGELYIAGNAVTMGYLNKHAMTQKKFISNPYNGEHKIMYRTGDCVRWLPEGNIEYLSRIDNQIKINGYRIEIAEIVENLLKYKDVQQCFITHQKNENGYGYLVAYIVTNDRPNFDIRKLKKFLLENNPIYTVPNKFIIVNYIPLNSNGKVDKTKLLSQYSENYLATNEYTPPQNNFQQILIDIWKSALNLSIIGINDDFFEIGGHSLVAMDIIGKINARLKINITTYDLFKYPTIKKLSKNLKSFTNNGNAQHHIICLSKNFNDGHPNIYLVHPLGGTIFWYKTLADELDGLYNIYGIEDPGLYNFQNYQFKTIEEMAVYYADLITQHDNSGSYILGGASFGANLSLKIAEYLLNNEQNIPSVLLFDGWANYQNDEEIKGDVLHYLKSTYTETQLRHHGHLDWSNFIDLQKNRKSLLLNYSVKITNLSTRIALFKASEISGMFKNNNQDDNGWGLFFNNNNSFSTYPIPGNHMTMFQPENIKRLSQTLVNFLNSSYQITAKLRMSQK